MLYDEECILLSKSTLIKDNLFHKFSVTVAIWDNFLGHNYKLHKALIMHKRIIRGMLGLRHTSFCRQKFKKLQTLTVPSVYIHEMIMFVIKHHGKYQTNDSIHSKDRTHKKKSNLQSIRQTLGQKGVCSSSIRILINFHHTLYNSVKIKGTSRIL